jgi:hypothetical protein
MGGKSCMRLSAVAFGVSLGILSGVFMMLFAWSAWTWGYGTAMMEQWGSIYPGYTASLVGGFVGLAWGFLEGFFCGLIWGWLYNLCLCCCHCCCCCKKSKTECVTTTTHTPPL